MHQKHTLFTLSFIFIDIKNVYQFINSGKLECSPPGKAGVPGLSYINSNENTFENSTLCGKSMLYIYAALW